MQIEFSVPGLLRDCCDHRQTFALDADTIDEAVAKALQTYPLLRRHVFDENGRLRRHVLICHNGENVAWLERADQPLRQGDQIAIMQAVSGG